MLTGMFTRLEKGRVLRPKNCNDATTPYIMILKNRSLFIEFYKTAKFSKNWDNDNSKLEVKIKKYDFKNYMKKVVNGDLRYPNEEEIIRLRENIEKLSKEVQRKIYGRDKLEIIANIKLFPDENYSPSYGFEMQGINKLDNKTELSIDPFSKDLSGKFYKRALSVTNILHL